MGVLSFASLNNLTDWEHLSTPTLKSVRIYPHTTIRAKSRQGRVGTGNNLDTVTTSRWLFAISSLQHILCHAAAYQKGEVMDITQPIATTRSPRALEGKLPRKTKEGFS